jgi:hypothetical protein
MSNLLANYENTVIYKIECKDVNITDIYIGHTTCYSQRYKTHKSNCNNISSKGYNYKIYKIIRENGGWDNWNMSIIENYPCTNVNEAKERERYWIEKESSSLNICIPNRSKKEYGQIYRIVHREEISEKTKIYRSNNKEKIKEYLDANKEKIAFQKQDWYEEKKDYILQKAKEHYQENKEQKLEYQKQYAQENKEEIAEKQKEYREKNKEEIAEKKKEYREKNKEELKLLNKKWREENKEKIQEQKKQVIVCECGHQITFGNKYTHLQSKFHLDYQNKLAGEPAGEPVVEIQISEEEKKKILHEKQKEYREKNADKIKEYKKIYNEKHKENNREQKKKYYDEHKSQIIEQNRQYVEENKEHIKEYKDEWYQKNKEKILAKQKLTFVCECGSEVRCAGKAEHLRSVKHQKYTENKKEI